MTSFALGVAATVIFAFFDYVGFNTMGKLSKIAYRIIQIVFQIGLGVGCCFLSGWKAPAVFLLLWLTFNADLIYYAFFDTLKWYGSGAFKREILGDECTWAGWTPLGWFRTQGSVVEGWEILLQAAIGIALALEISIYF